MCILAGIARTFLHEGNLKLMKEKLNGKIIDSWPLHSWHSPLFIQLRKFNNINRFRWLASIRKERGLTVRDVGKLIGEHHQLISRIETLQRKLNIYEYIQYCEALEINSDEGLEILKIKK